VAFVPDVGFEHEIAAARVAHPGIRWDALALPSVPGLISQVSDGTVGYAIVGSLAASLARNIYLDFDVAFPAGAKRDIAWAVAPGLGALRQDLDRFILQLGRDGTLARLADRYMPDPGQIQRIDAEMLQEKIRTVLPQYRSPFHDGQERAASTVALPSPTGIAVGSDGDQRHRVRGIMRSPRTPPSTRRPRPSIQRRTSS
jgi:membrane-bound lytic murein transglycosylase MltF